MAFERRRDLVDPVARRRGPEVALHRRRQARRDQQRSVADRQLDGRADYSKLGARNYLDLFASWQIDKNWLVRAGVNNVLDKDPPITSTTLSGPSIFGNGNTFPQVYDSLGRLFFLNITAKF